MELEQSRLRMEITFKQCRYCGNFVRMICQQGTGFCSQQCEDNWKAKHNITVTVVPEEWHG